MVGNTPTSMQAHRGTSSVCRVSVAETVSIPARHELIVTAKLQSKGRGFQHPVGIGIFEPKQRHGGASDILMARVVADPAHKQIPVRLINLSSDNVVLYKNTNIGTFTAVDHSDVGSEKKKDTVGFGAGR